MKYQLIAAAMALSVAATGSATSVSAQTTSPKASSTLKAPAPSKSMAMKKAPVKEKIVTLPSGLQYVDEVVGTGPIAAVGTTASVRCIGKLTDSTEFWGTTAKYNYDKPLEFKVGAGQMIKGMDEGVSTMRAGGHRKLIIPYNLAYGENGRPPTIPAKSTLVFDVNLLSVK